MAPLASRRQESRSLRRLAFDLVLISIGALLMLAPALVNGFPFVYSDTGTYLRSAFTGEVPFDRPYWYGGFVKLISANGISLWGVAIAQAVLCAWYVLRVQRAVLPMFRSPWLYLGVVGLLSAATGVGWYAGLLIPDVFTGIGLLAIFMLLNPYASAWSRVLDAALIAIACWFHSSNLLILPLSGLVLVLLHARRDRMRLAGIWLSATVAAWGSLALANRMLVGEAYVTRNGHVFLMGRMLDLGMLGPYLDEHCSQEAFVICQYRDSLPPHSQEFLWGGSSPVSKQGGWEATKTEYDRIVRGSFTQPRYLWWHVRGSSASTLEQLATWEICHAMRSEWYRVPDSAPRLAIAALVPHDEERFMAALQQGGRGELSMRWPDLAYRMVLALSLVILVVALWRREEHGTGARRLLLFAITGIVIGAWVCASLSIVDSRYLGRDSWLLPFAAMLYVASSVRRK